MLKAKILGIALAMVILVSTASLAEIPSQISFQGILKDSSSAVVDDATYSVTFTIYDDSISGNTWWQEEQDIETDSGYFTVLLGSVNPIPDSAFAGADRYLAIQITGDDEMTERIPISSTAYSYRDDDWVVDGDNVYRLDGNIGIGLTQPERKLDVDGGIRAGGSASLYPNYAIEAIGKNHNSVIGAFTNSTTNNVAGFRVGRENEDSLNQLWALEMDGYATGSQDFSLVDYMLSSRRVWTAQQGTGNIGIGNPNPEWKLDVGGTGRFNGLLPGNTTFYYGESATFLGGGGMPSGRLLCSSGDDLHIKTVTANNNIILMPDGSGMVGIGTESPQMKLHVSGQAIVSQLYLGWESPYPYLWHNYADQTTRFGDNISSRLSISHEDGDIYIPGNLVSCHACIVV